jgi:monoamine oxidase
MSISRREFISRVGCAGGFAAAFITMRGLGLQPLSATAAEPIAAPAGIGKGVKLLVLGGGIAGLVAAYEAQKLNYDVTLLEARHRPGGRCWSAKNGDVVEFIDGTMQPVTWSEGLYQNMGPGRLPSVHTTMLGYCREFKIPLEVEINTSRYTFLQNDKVNGGKPYTQRKVINDTRGEVSELLSKAVVDGGLDKELTREDREKLLEALKTWGPLDKDGKYKGSARADISRYPGAGTDTLVVNPDTIPLHVLLEADFWTSELYEENWDWQATMMQPVGGMQQIANAFAGALGDAAAFDAPVTAVARTSDGVRVSFEEGGATRTIDAHYAICAMPLSILKKIKADLSPDHRRVVNASQYRTAYKVPWESRRFWETDYNIYGGLSFLSQGPSPVWYPSAGLMSERGILCAGYSDEMATGFDKMTMEERFAASRGQVEKLHPGHGHELEKPIYCGWKHIKWNEGSWIGGVTQQDYDVISAPDGPIYFAGDHASHLIGWQEGAALSGKRAVQMICDRIKSAGKAA